MSQSLNTVSQSSGTVGGTAQTAAAAPQSMASMAPQMMSQLGQLPQMFGQIPQMLGQFPQMLGQFPQMAMGMLGPLSKVWTAAASSGLDKVAGRIDQTALAATTDAAARGGGGGGAGGIGGGARGDVQLHPAHRQLQRAGTAASCRPAGRRAVRRHPKSRARSSPPPGPAPEGSYGAPAAAGAAGHMGRDERGREGSADGRTMQLTVGPRTGRED